ncbi:Serine/Threonine protein kinase, partial [Orpheovirus IHUMI-LCC2]
LLLIDYGFACKTVISDPYRCEKKSGSPNFMAPELFKYNISTFIRLNLLSILKASDVWALGICIWILCNLKRPYKSGTYNDLKKEILESNAPSLLDTKTDDDLKNKVHEMVNSMLNKNFKQRITPDNLLYIYY